MKSPDREIPVLTLSKGEFEEFHDQERFVQIGSVLFDTETMLIVQMNYIDTAYSEATLEPEVTSRWLTNDPLRQYASPYVGMGNNPVNGVDPDGAWSLDIIVTNQSGDELFRLDDGKTEISYMTAGDLYKTGIQWFSPKADNYMSLISTNPELTSMLTKNFEWSDIADFSAIDPRSPFDFLQGGSADWKAVSNGADGYFLITVGGKPYWSDAVGQIPYAVWAYKQLGNIKDVVNKGVEYGEGKIFGKPELGNTYDMYWVLRGALYGRARYHSIGNNMWQENPNPPSPEMLSYPINQKIGQ